MVSVPARPLNPSTRWNASVAHAQAGGLQELTNGRVRPFFTGVLGLTRYAAEGDSEVRFAVGAGGGVKFFPVSHVGLRLDGRVYTTIVDADARSSLCAAAAGASPSSTWTRSGRPSSRREWCSDSASPHILRRSSREGHRRVDRARRSTVASAPRAKTLGTAVPAPDSRQRMRGSACTSGRATGPDRSR